MFVCGILHVCFCVKNGIVLRKYDVVSHQGFTWLYFPFLDVVVCRPFSQKSAWVWIKKKKSRSRLILPSADTLG